MNWRDHLPIHPAAELFPLMSKAELRELGEDIKQNGMTIPIVVGQRDKYDTDFKLWDGRNRLDALEAVGLLLYSPPAENKGPAAQWPNEFFIKSSRTGPWPVPVKVLREDEANDPQTYIISANLHRRHLTTEQKRELIAKLIKANPEKSNRQIAGQVKASHPHVAKVRTELEKTGDVETVSTSIDTKGRKQPAKRKRAVSEPSQQPARKPKTVKLEDYAADMVCTRGDDGVDVWSAPQLEVSLEQRRAEMAALAAATEEAADKPEHKAPSVNGNKADADDPKKTDERITVKEINAFHSEAVGFLLDFTERLRAWCAARPPIDKDGKAALMQALYLCADGFADLAQELDGDLVVDDLSIPASLRRVPS